MELQFSKSVCPYLDTVVNEVQNTEQTQELRLSDGMPDIGRVLTAWGQPVLRGKEWRSDSIAMNGGMMVWVLYAPEDGTEPRCVEGWLPFQLRWELPEDVPEGQIRLRLLPRFVDGRSVSARKLMLRAGAAALAQAWSPGEAEVCTPGEVPEDVELLRSVYPIRMPREAGEKTFLLDEDLTMPGSAPQPEKLVYYTVRPEITDQKVLGDKVVFRGNGNLHILYRSEEGQLHSWDFPLAFSQYSELKGSHSADAGVDVALCPTNLELELDDEGHLRLKCGLVGQYLVDDLELLETVEDAYSTSRALTSRVEELTVPAILETRRENMYGEQTLKADANLAADISFLPDFPRQYRTGDTLALEMPGMYQALYYDENGAMQASSGRWEGKRELNADQNTQVTAIPMAAPEPQMSLGSGSMTLKNEIPLQLTSLAEQRIPMVTGLELGDAVEPDPGRPSMILRRAGQARLWDIAKHSGSTVASIRQANGLQGEPAPEQMLLIPVM